MPHDVDRDMIAARDVVVEEDTVQHRLADKLDPSLLDQLALQRFQKGLAVYGPARQSSG